MKRRSGLGRGLDALIPAPAESPGVETVPWDDIEPNPSQPRRSFEEGSLAELAGSIRELGILQPLLVRRVAEDRYQLVAGERRWRAAKLAGLLQVPVIEVDTDDGGALERALVENIHRSDLNPLEEASAYQELLTRHSLTHEALAERVNKSRATITNTLRLLDLPTDVQRLLVDRRITGGHAKALLGLEGNPMLSRLAARVAAEGLSVRETEELVRRYQDFTTPQAHRRTERSRPPEVAEAQRLLQDNLQTRVRVEMGKRKGRVVIDFTTLDELQRLTGAIVGEGTQAAAVAAPEGAAQLS